MNILRMIGLENSIELYEAGKEILNTEKTKEADAQMIVQALIPGYNYLGIPLPKIISFISQLEGKALITCGRGCRNNELGLLKIKIHEVELIWTRYELIPQDQES